MFDNTSDKEKLGRLQDLPGKKQDNFLADEAPSLSTGEIKDEITDKSEDKPVKVKPKGISIYAMPTKFIPDAPKQAMAIKTKVVFLVVILVIFLGALIAGAFFYLDSQVNQDDIVNIANDNPPAISDQPDISNNQPIANDIVNEPETDENEDKDDGNTDIVVNLDEDGDGLTAEEEAMYSTNINRSDSDRDGYSDGVELVNLYNPLVPGESLANSNLINVYVNTPLNYSVFRPSAWVIADISGDTSEINLLPNSATGQLISISVKSNIEQASLGTIAQSFFPAGVVPINYSLANQPSLRTDTRVLMLKDGSIYSIVYEIPESDLAHYSTTLDMILNSFELLDLKNEEGLLGPDGE